MQPRRSRTFTRTVACVLVLRAAQATADVEARVAPGSPEELFREGRDALKHGEIVLACEKFAESQRREPAKGTLLNLALCLEQAGRLLEAREQFQRLLDWADLDEARRVLAAEHLASVEKQLPRLVIRLDATDLAGATFLLDGREVPVPGSSGEPIALDPGRHVLRIVRVGVAPRDVQLDLRAGTDFLLSELPREVPLSIVQAPRAVPAPVPPRSTAQVPPPSSGARAPHTAYVLGGLGLVGLAVGSVTGILVIDRAATVDAHCENKVCDQEGFSAGESGRVLSTVSTVSFVLGAGLTAVGGYLLLTTPDEQRVPGIAIDVSSRAASVGVGGRF